MATTPLKITDITCFVCCVRNSRNFTLDGRKSTSNGFVDKLKFLLNDENLCSSLSDLEHACVCRNCFSKVENTSEFVKQLKASAVKYVAGGSLHVKMVALSQATPKSSIDNTLVPVSVDSRKQLKLGISPLLKVTTASKSPAENKVLNDSEIFSAVAVDHGYSESSETIANTKMNTNSVFNDIESMFHNLNNEKEDMSVNVMLQDLRSQSASLLSRTTMFSSVLYKNRDIHKLQENEANLLDDIVKEMIHRVPLLLKVMLCVAVPTNRKVKESLIPVLASAYSILMKHKYDNLSAYHRLTSAIAIKGGLNERAQKRLNHLGLVLSWQARVALQNNIQSMSDKHIGDTLKQNPQSMSDKQIVDTFTHNPLNKVTGLMSDNSNMDTNSVDGSFSQTSQELPEETLVIVGQKTPMCKRYQCDHCPYRASMKHHLKRHIMLMHKDTSSNVNSVPVMFNRLAGKKHKCNISSYSTIVKSNIIKHAKLNNKINSNDSLLVQLNSHADKKHKCDLCPFRTKQKGNLKRHIMLMHNDTNSDVKWEHVKLSTLSYKKHQCDLCSFRSKEKSSLKAHITLRHKAIISDSNSVFVVLNKNSDKTHSCDLCQYKTTSNGYLKRHIKVRHTNNNIDAESVSVDLNTDKKYKCDLCSYRASVESCLKGHITLRHSNTNTSSDAKSTGIMFNTHADASTNVSFDHIEGAQNLM